MNRHCPFPGYAQLRREAPAWFDRSANIWIVSRYQDVRAMLRDSQSFSASALGEHDFEICSPTSGHRLSAERSLLSSDPPAHDRFRSIITPFFNAKAIQSYLEGTRSVLKDRMRTVGPAGHSELVQDLCAPTMANTVRQLLGVEAAKSESVLAWMGLCGQLNARSRPAELRQSFEKMIAEIWESAQAVDSGLLGTLVDLSRAKELDDAQVLDFVVAILKGGADTVSYLVGNALMMLGDQPDPSPAFLEESLRFDSPVQMTVRLATREVNLSGTVIPRGGLVLLLIGSANHDEEAFRDAETFRVGQEGSLHLAFGVGAHRCPGAEMARIHARMILTAVLSQWRGLRIQTELSRPTDRAAFRGFDQIHVSFKVSSGQQK